MTLTSVFPQALKNLYHGANASLALILTGFPAHRFTVIGVTGTDGKTTTASLIYHLLQTAGYKVGLISTVGAYIGPKSLDTGFHVTTPNPLKLQRLLRDMKRDGLTHVVIEATSHGLDQHRLMGTHIDLAVITNVTPEHLDYHHSFDRYLKAKAKIFKTARTVFLNADDPAYPKLKTLVPAKTHLVVYSRHKLGPLTADVTRAFPQSYNQENAAAAINVAYILKIKKSLIKQALLSFPQVPGRLQFIPNHLGIRLCVDFAHTPNALNQALVGLRLVTQGKLIAVFGAAGERDRSKRPLMGEIGARLADEVVLTSEDPRSEPVTSIIRQILDGVKQNFGHVHSVIDRQAAINFAMMKLAKPGDTVGIFGKGHEQSLNLDGRHEIPWSDHQAVAQALKQL